MPKGVMNCGKCEEPILCNHSYKLTENPSESSGYVTFNEAAWNEFISSSGFNSHEFMLGSGSFYPDTSLGFFELKNELGVYYLYQGGIKVDSNFIQYPWEEYYMICSSE